MRAAGLAEAGRRPGGGAAETGGARLPRRSRGGLRPVCLPLAGGGGAAETGGARLPRRSRGGLRPVCLPLAGGGGGEKCRPGARKK